MYIQLFLFQLPYHDYDYRTLFMVPLYVILLEYVGVPFILSITFLRSSSDPWLEELQHVQSIIGEPSSFGDSIDIVIRLFLLCFLH